MTAAKLSDMADRAKVEPIAHVIDKIMTAQAAGTDVISLAAGLPDPSMLPMDKIADLFKEASNKYPGLLNYTRPQGWPPLNAAFEQMLSKQGVACSAARILVTSGGMEGLSLAAQLTLNPGDTVLVESPAFPGAISTFKLLGAKVVHVDCDKDGMLPDALKSALQTHHPKLVSLMPDNQNPSGATLPLERREQIAKLLKEFDVYAVEDGAYAQLRFEDGQIPPLQSFAPEHVFYATSVSKILAPAMRVGCLVAPTEAMMAKANGIKSSYNMQASAMNEAMSECFLTSHYLSDNLALLRKTYKHRRDLMIEALQESFPEGSGFTWNSPQGGMFLWLTGPESVDFEVLLDKAIEQGVAYIPGDMFYAEPNQASNAARINFASIPEDKIKEAIQRLAAALNLV